MRAFSRRGGACVRVLTVFLTVLFLFAGQARAATYYVATTGSDGNNGTSEATAWRTIQKGADVATAGDTVVVLPGTYTGSIRQTKDGTASGRITFISKDFYDKTGRWGAKIVATNENVGVSIIGEYVDIIGFDVTGDSSVHNGIALYGNGTRAMYNHVHDLRAPNCGSGGGSGIVTPNYTTSNKEIIGNVVHHIGSAHLGSAPYCNKIHGIYTGVPNVRVFNNISYSNASAGIHSWHAPIDNVIAYNLSFSNRGSGIIFGCGDAPNVQCKGIKVYNNIFMNNQGRAIVEYGNNDSSNVVVNNITYQNQNDTPVMKTGTASNNLIGVNPQLVNFQPGGGSNIEDYRPVTGSPAIDAASNACAGCNINSDILLGARPFGGGFDIGPLETGSTPNAVPPPIASSGGGTTGGTCPPGTVPGPGGGIGGAGGSGVTAPLPTGSATVGIPLPPQGGKTWYVATNGGSDSNPGTEAAPFKTIARGSQALASGDTLLIRGGTYNERMMDGADGFKFVNGTASAYTRYAAYQGEQVLIRPTKFSNYTVWFSVRNAYIELSGLTVDGENTIYELRTDNFHNSSGVLLSAHHIRVIGNEIKSPNDKIITVNGQAYSDSSCILFGGGPNNELIGNHIHDCGSYGIYAQYSGGLIEGNVVHDTGRYAVHLFSYHTNDNWIIRNNRFYDNGIRGSLRTATPGIRQHSPSVLISHGKNNQVYNNLVYGSHAGIRVWGNADNTLVANNTVYGNKGYGIRVDSTNSDNTRIINNISYGNGGGQIENVGAGTVQQNNLTSNPNFVNAAGGDFHLNAGSAAIDKGVTLPQVPNDFYYGTRPFGSAYDIGAIEQGAPPGTPPDGGIMPPPGGGATGGLNCIPAPVCPPGTMPAPGSGTAGGPASVDQPPATGPITPPPAGAGNTYWVATNGSDSAAGTAAAPWKTIAYAVKKMNAGDTTYVRGGTYNEKYILFNKSGAPGAPIRLLNAPGEKPKIDFGLIGGVSGQPVNRIEINAPGITPIGHITIEGFEISRAWDGLKYHDAHDIVFRRNWVHHSINQGILGNGKRMFFDRNVINHNGNFERCAAGALTKIGTSVCNQAHGMYLTGRDYIITNNLIYDSSAYGIQVAGYEHCPGGVCPSGGTRYTKEFADVSYGGADNFFIANNTIAYNNYRSAIVLWQSRATNSKIINNIFYENSQKYPDTNGVSFVGSGGGHTISNNLCYATSPGATTCIGANGAGKYTGSGNIVNTVNPNFVSAGPTLPFAGIADFHLNAGSPAIDTGLTLPNVTQDHGGGLRPFGAAYDVGAYEYGSPPDPEAPAPTPTWPPGGGTTGGAPVCVPVGCGADAGAPVTPPVVTGATTTPTGTGRNYYMSPSGNDSNPGTEAAPWKTMDRLQQAQSILRPGDTVWFRGGDYIVDDSRARAYYSWRAAGTASNPIIYRNYTGEIPTILVDARAPRTDAGTFIFVGSHVIIDGLNVRRTEGSRSLSQAPDGSIIRDTGLPGTAFGTWGDGVVIRNCLVENFTLGIYYAGSNILVENCKIIGTISHAFYIAGRAGTWRYNETDGSRGYPNQQGIQIQYQTSIGNKIYGNLMKNGRASGVVFSGSVANNEVFNNIIVNGGSKADGSFGYALSFWCEKDHTTHAPARALGGNKFYNNTIIGKSNSNVIADRVGTTGAGPYCHAMNGGRPLAENVQIYNNIFYPSPPPAQTLVPLSSVRNNIFYNIRGAAPPGNMLVNPMLANPTGTMAADAMLQAGSPAIDAAIDPGPDLDYQGGTRPVGPRKDIGAFEFGAPPGPLGGPLGSANPPPAGCPVTPPPPHVIEEGVYLCPP